MDAGGPNTKLREHRRNRYGLPGDEQVIFWRRHHWTVLVRMVLVPIIVTLGTVLLFLVVSAQLDAPVYEPGLQMAQAVVQVILLGLVVLSLVGLVYQIWNWSSDWIILTNRRLIVREATPLLREQRREIPLGKVQNAITTLPGPLHMSLNFGRLVVDTAGLGQVRVEDVPNPALLRDLIMAEQKKVMAASQPTRANYLQHVARNILYDVPAPAAPQGTLAVPSPREGFGLFNTLFPFRPQRDGLTVVWHKHWWFLLRGLLIPILLLLFFEGVEIAAAVFFTVIGSDQNPADPILAFVRPFIWFIALLVALYQWEDWRNDYYEIRDDRLIDREALPLGLFEQTKQTELRRITDIRNEVPGPLAMLLDFGDVIIKTPGEAVAFTFDGVPKPREVLGEIMDRIEALREREQFQTTRDMQDLLRAFTREIQHWQQQQVQHAPPQPPSSPQP
jgi:hypothetical protein